jgi:hypothetical protein
MVKFTVEVHAPDAPNKVPMTFPQATILESDDFEILIGILTFPQVLELGNEFVMKMLKNWSDQTGSPIPAGKVEYLFDIENPDPIYTPQKKTRSRK